LKCYFKKKKCCLKCIPLIERNHLGPRKGLIL